MTRRRIRALVLIAAGIAVAGGVAAATMGGRSRPRPATASAGVPTAVVERRDLAETLDVDATLGFGDERTVISRAAGLVTDIAPPGKSIKAGQPLYALDGTPVALLDGSVPASRDLREGITDGDDVAELERNLERLGCDPNHLLVVDRHFSASTRAAIETFQHRLGAPITGELDLGSVVFLPGERRVTTVYAHVGDALTVGARVLDTASTSRVATFALDTSQRSLVAIGSRVDVDLPDGSAVQGTVSLIGGTATTDPNADPSAGPDSTVTVGVSIARPLPAPDGTPVTVSITTRRREHVLSVPVTALLATSGGHRALEVLESDGATRIVAVHAGVYAGGYVEINGRGIQAGTRVVDAPAS